METEPIKAKYEKRIIALLNAQRKVLRDEGIKTSRVYEMSDQEYAYTYVIYDGKTHKYARNGDIDVTFTIAESENREGTDEGIAFALDLVEYSGLIVGGMTPYNYSDELWIPLSDEDAIEERFNLFERANNDSLLNLVQEFRAR